ncbi:helix-turn-helix domain-containing protein [Arthrobacter sp. PAMC25284]|uniref:helix-turn-helix domain-containing protein n=1 Tax=Arthrobacter sp. PAMC25284 TaxID=2861279 RepID=UPI001C628E38|nr:helix-turn-helix transcriptional regulator [Arthrobacter sp. PAMC25284]QYF88546.1 helix-turn-helix transcriptional regulator [Arthrobacter sp. PAMC25284]
MAGKEITEGATGLVVRENIKRIRESRDMSWAQMSRFLERAGRPIAALGLRRIEDGSRRVDVDDLMAIAVVLDVAPNDLLLPQASAGTVNVTGVVGRDAEHLWAWAEGRLQLDSDEPWAGFRSRRTDDRPAAEVRLVLSKEDFTVAIREALRDD